MTTEAKSRSAVIARSAAVAFGEVTIGSGGRVLFGHLAVPA
jgi:hypothetical protein